MSQPHEASARPTPPPESPQVDTPAPSSRVDLGLVSLNAAQGWSFYPLPDRVIGRPGNRVGGMTILPLPASSVGWPATHEACMSAAVAATHQPIQGPGFDRAKEFEDCCMAGGESFRTGKNYVRVWYRHCGDGMVAAWFRCKQTRAAERSVIESLRAADRMIATVRLPPPVA